MVMLRREGDDKKKVKKLSRLHFYIILGIVALIVALGAVSENTSYHEKEQAETISGSTKEQYTEFMDYHIRAFITTRDEMARYDAIYRAEPFIHREELDAYVDNLISFCNEAIEFPAPEDKQLAEIHEQYVESMKGFKKALRLYPDAYQDSRLFDVYDDLALAEDLFRISRKDLDESVEKYELYKRGN